MSVLCCRNSRACCLETWCHEQAISTRPFWKWGLRLWSVRRWPLTGTAVTWRKPLSETWAVRWSWENYGLARKEAWVTKTPRKLLKDWIAQLIINMYNIKEGSSRNIKFSLQGSILHAWIIGLDWIVGDLTYYWIFSETSSKLMKLFMCTIDLFVIYTLL